LQTYTGNFKYQKSFQGFLILIYLISIAWCIFTDMEFLTAYQQLLAKSLSAPNAEKTPQGLYAPIDYLLSLGGKRLRPLLVLMACEAFGGEPKKAVHAAKAVELFHNFTLMHDDIMDHALLRRGQQTVHEKWDVNTAILSGDAMLVQAYACLNDYPPELFKALTQLLSKTALEVCEGQQYDVDFETQTNVQITAYLEMIRLKTAVLVGCAMGMGALIGGATADEAKQLYQFGEQLGIAFQLQDDYLDSFGNEASFGKRIGGDIVENKKTILVHLAQKLGTSAQQAELAGLLSNTPQNEAQKIGTVKALFVATGADGATLSEVERYTQQAFAVLDLIKLQENHKKRLQDFGTWLMKRSK
jgi:geranylgeranyl diphosphate synthase type II